jgi:hypothetical protein
MSTASLPHGYSRYTNHGCRCDECRRANREYSRKYRSTNAKAREYDRWQTATYTAALSELRNRHRAEFEQILAEIRRSQGMTA